MLLWHIYYNYPHFRGKKLRHRDEVTCPKLQFVESKCQPRHFNPKPMSLPTKPYA